MVSTNRRIERCLILLIRYAKENGGYFSYQFLSHVMKKTGCEQTIDFVDYLYDQIVKRSIKIGNGSTNFSNVSYEASVPADYETAKVDSQVSHTYKDTRMGGRRKFYNRDWCRRYYYKKCKNKDSSKERAEVFLEEIVEEFYTLGKATRYPIQYLFRSVLNMAYHKVTFLKYQNS